MLHRFLAPLEPRSFCKVQAPTGWWFTMCVLNIPSRPAPIERSSNEPDLRILSPPNMVFNSDVMMSTGSVCSGFEAEFIVSTAARTSLPCKDMKQFGKILN